MISGSSEIVADLKNNFDYLPVESILAISLLSFQIEMFQWFLDMLNCQDDIQRFVYLSKHLEPIPEDAFNLTDALTKIEFSFQLVFSSRNVLAMIYSVEHSFFCYS